MFNNEVLIVCAYRTPIGSLNGSLSSLKASDLGSLLIRTILEKVNKDLVPDDVIIGQALTAGQGQNPARQSAINAGLPNKVNATTINMLCGSGLKACVLAYQAIKCGDANVVICGGQESMSQAPHCLNLRKELKMGDGKMIDTMIYDGLTDAFENVHMGITAEAVAVKYEVSRQEQDEFALNSQRKYAQAFKNGAFINEIIPVRIKQRGGDKIISTDEFPRIDTAIEGLRNLKPAFKKEDGTVTAGNASGINDGAAMLLLMSSNEAQKQNLNPLVRIVSWAQSGCDPMLMGICPIDAIKCAIQKACWTVNDIDLFEINEAFATQSIAILKTLNLDQTKVNVNGGSIALGHPIGIY
jgi:acetyl-CoA C-acetyltransferase